MKNENIVVKITDIGINGEGIAKLDNKIVFIDSVLIGETVHAKIVQQKKNIIFAKAYKIENPSPNRRTPMCPVFFSCGGCDLQHIDYNTQLLSKQNSLYSTIKKQIGIDYNFNNIVMSPKEFEYRNKVQLPIQNIDNKIVVGFYKKKSHDIVAITHCPLHGKWLTKIISIFTTWANTHKVSAYNETTKQGLLRHLVIRKLANSISIVLVVNGNKIPFIDKLYTDLAENTDENISLHYSINTKHTNVILDGNNKLVHLYGPSTITTTINDIDIVVSPLSFFQVNNEVSKMIYNKVVEEVTGENNIVVDAYSGAGLLTALISKNVFFATGIEIIPQAVDNANNLVKDNNIKNMTNICGDVKKHLPEVVENYKVNYPNKNIIIVLDPPRKGCDNDVLTTTLSTMPNKIVYVSCNPATLARDLKILLNDDLYKIDYVTPYDMFPQTYHVETLAVLSKK